MTRRFVINGRVLDIVLAPHLEVYPCSEQKESIFLPALLEFVPKVRIARIKIEVVSYLTNPLMYEKSRNG